MRGCQAQSGFPKITVDKKNKLKKKKRGGGGSVVPPSGQLF